MTKKYKNCKNSLKFSTISYPFSAITTLVIFYIIEINSSLAVSSSSSSSRPHIIFILADDLGWNDIGFHGSAQIPTPNIDALAYSGLILNRYYVNPICTPSRSALMTGKYPIHTGMQHTVLYGAEPRGLPLTEKILPEYLNELGYSSHIAGKWHLGHYKKIYTPLYRGFKTHLGFWTGHHDYFDHTAIEKPSWGLDIRRGLDIPYDLHGEHTTDIITNESVNVIKNHNKSIPLFLYVAHAAVHSSNPYDPLPVSDDVVAKLDHITDNYKRRKFAAMVTKLDDSVGAIVNELHKNNMLSNSIVIFSTDNGGPSEGFNLNYASNWPLRGVKNTLWEGGVRGAAFMWSPLIEKQKRVSDQTMHIVDWLPTLLNAASSNHLTGNVSNELDGISIWNELSQDKISPRKEILHNIDDIWGSAALTMGDWKILLGSHYNGIWDGWYGPAGDRSDGSYDVNNVFKSKAGKVIKALHMMPTNDEIFKLRHQANVNCSSPKSYLLKGTTCEPLTSPCLFNIRDDPCENFNLAMRYPNILKAMLAQIEKYNSTAIPPGNMPLDSRADPRFWDNTWTNFGDFYEKE